MKITAPEEYGLRCLLRLASQPADTALTIPEIAASERLSAPNVAKMMGILRQAGFVASVRGRAGGYCLARPANQIRVGQVLAALGDPLYEDGYCERHAGTENKGEICVHTSDCAVRAVWRTLGDLITSVLDQLTLADLLCPEAAMQQLLVRRQRLPLPLAGVGQPSPH
jgi:Rrf2 family protein